MRAALLALVVALPAGSAMANDGARSDYILRCAGCHGMSGEGTLRGGVPAFPDSIGAIAESREGRAYIFHVPGVQSASLDPAETAEVMNYILDQWSDGRAPPFSEAEVREHLSRPVPDIVALRRAIAEELARSGIEIAPYPWP